MLLLVFFGKGLGFKNGTKSLTTLVTSNQSLTLHFHHPIWNPNVRKDKRTKSLDSFLNKISPTFQGNWLIKNLFSNFKISVMGGYNYDMKIKVLALMCYLILSWFSVQATELVLKVEANQADYLLGEPVVLYVSLLNSSDEEVQMPLELKPVSGFVHYQVRQQGSLNGSESLFFPWATLDYIVDPIEKFYPGQIVREEVKLFFGSMGWTFQEPGTYEITAKMGEELSSNTVTITVDAPTDKQTIAAAELFLGSVQVGFFLLFEGGDHLKEGIQRLKQVATQYPETPHATYANQALGNRLVNDFADFLEKRLRPEDPASALPFLEKAQQKPISFYDTLHTHLSLYEAYTKLNNISEADSTITKLVEIVSTQFEDFFPFLTDIFDKNCIRVTTPPPSTMPASCLLYAVHDESRKDTQFFTVEPSEDFKVKLLGALHYEQDIEALDIHPETNLIFAASGDDGSCPGHLYNVDAKTGVLSMVGKTGFREINGLSFKPDDGSLWGWAEHDGLIQINTQTGVGRLELPYKKRVEDLTWDNEGNLLYAIQNNTLLVYNRNNKTVSQLDCKLPAGEIEALEMLPDDRLLFSIHNDATLSIYALEVKSCQIVGTDIRTSLDEIKLNDVEGIAWPVEACTSP